jgi:hypothetical protein
MCTSFHVLATRTLHYYAMSGLAGQIYSLCQKTWCLHDTALRFRVKSVLVQHQRPTGVEVMLQAMGWAPAIQLSNRHDSWRSTSSQNTSQHWRVH